MRALNIVRGKLFFLFVWILVFAGHPVHVSVANIELDRKSDSVTVSLKIFSDDFQNLIMQKYGVEMNIIGQEHPGEQIDVIHRYIEEAFSLRINGKSKTRLEFHHLEMNREAIWLYYSGSISRNIHKIRVKNAVMMELFQDQTNLVIVSHENGQEGYRLTHGHECFEIELDSSAR